MPQTGATPSLNSNNMARQIQLRGDTEAHWLEADPILAEKELALVATDPGKPHVYDQMKVGDGLNHFSQLSYRGLPAVQSRGDSLTQVMSQFAVTRELERIDQHLDENAGTLGEVVQDLATHGQILLSLTPEGGNWHRQNSDTGTDSRVFRIHRVRLENCHSGLEIRNDNDSDYENVTLKDLIVKGRLLVDKGFVTTEAEEVRTADTWIVVNAGEEGEGITAGKAGMEIDRGTLAPAFFFFDETDQAFKAGTGEHAGLLVCVEGLPEDGVSLVWDEERKGFIPGTDSRALRKDRIRIVEELPDEDAPDLEDGDIFLVAEDEETGEWKDFLSEFRAALQKPRCALCLEVRVKRNDPQWVDGTQVVSLKAEFAVASEVGVLYQSGKEWLPFVTLAEGTQETEQAVPPEWKGRIFNLCLERMMGDEQYVYLLPPRIEIPNF